MNESNIPLVRVYIWRGASSQTVDIGSFVPSFGHVALETRLGDISRYISFWPGKCNTDICKQQRSHYHTKEIDEIYERRPADVPLYNPSGSDERFYTLINLDVKKINDWYDKHKGDFSWALQGSSILKGSNEFNCAGLTYRLLELGGLHKIAPNHSTQRIKRIVAATSFAALSFAPVCYWSHYTFRPVLQYQHDFGVYNVGVVNIFDAIFNTLNTLKKVHEYVLNGELALINVYNLELNSYPSFKNNLKDTIDWIQERHRNAVINFDMLQFDLIDNYVATNFKRIMEYSPFLTLSGLASLSVILIGLGVSFFNNKIVSETMTPADVEDLVCCALKREEESITEKGLVSWRSLKLGLFAAGVGLVAYNFFKDGFKSINFEEELNWRKI